MYLKFKNVIDIILGIILILIFSPLFLVLIILCLIFQGKPVFFIQTRPGLSGKLFNIVKFRTMLNRTNKDSLLLHDSKRLTKFGFFLRKTSLDELPELLNIVKRQMSFVGPRPLLPQYLDRYTPEQMRRHEVKPGITGWAQVNGRNTLSWEEKFKLDVWYVDNISFKLDMKILFLTLVKVIKREGINHPGTATMEEFLGSE